LKLLEKRNKKYLSTPNWEEAKLYEKRGIRKFLIFKYQIWEEAKLWKKEE
jgi:hypothetical protein